MHKSLTKRIISLSIFWIILALLATALLLGQLYRDHIEEHYDAHVFTHVEELIAAVRTDSEGRVGLHREPTDPRFHRPRSGWYWEVLSDDQPVVKSASLGDERLDLQGITLDENHGVQTVFGPNGQKLRANVVHVSYPSEPGSLTFIATAPQFQITDDVQDFATHVLTSFLVLAIGLSVAVVMQVRVALKPLRAIRQEISDIKSGTTERLSQDFPADVQPLVDELNFLLDHNELLLKRARNQLGDLAHAVKTPLTVIRNEARTMENKQGQLILEQTHLIASDIDHYLSRARIYGKKDAIGYRTSVRSVIDDLVYAVRHIYKEKAIDIRQLSLDDKWFRGEAQDLEEMAGNLLDNACKWATSEVCINCESANDRLKLVIEDNGPGIPEEEREGVMRRGRKLDESRPGHGHGLGIVRDIALLYGGSLTLGDSDLGGLKAVLNLPSS
ncbi:MAG: ATP-binding protein [Xanthomonadales bacterium]|nr:ATP-binding protein [Xanthomonadales bacterium]